MPLYANQVQALKTIANIKNELEKNVILNTESDLEIMYRELKQEYCREIPENEILQTAHLTENIFRRMRKRDSGYHGPKIEGCIRLALAMDIDNINDIDDLVMAGGYASILEERDVKSKKYKQVVEILIREEELEPEDKVKVFEKFI